MTAHAANQDFLALRKDANPEIPFLIGAKSECAQLKLADYSLEVWLSKATVIHSICTSLQHLGALAR
jgi:hypothetical protein